MTDNPKHYELEKAVTIDSDKCIECKTEVVHYYRSMFCKDCTKNFFEGDKDERINTENRAVGNGKRLTHS